MTGDRFCFTSSFSCCSRAGHSAKGFPGGMSPPATTMVLHIPEKSEKEALTMKMNLFPVLPCSVGLVLSP